MLPGPSVSVMGRRAKPAYGSPSPFLAPGPVSWGSMEWREGLLRVPDAVVGWGPCRPGWAVLSPMAQSLE